MLAVSPAEAVATNISYYFVSNNLVLIEMSVIHIRIYHWKLFKWSETIYEPFRNL